MSALVTLVAVGALLFVVGWLAPVIAPLGLGLFLAALAAPSVRWFESHGRSRPVALAITVGLVVAIGAAIVLLAIVSGRTLSESLDRYAGDLEARYLQAADVPGSAGIRELVPPEALAGILRSVITILGQLVSSLAVAIVLAALLLVDAPRLSRLSAAGYGRSESVFREVPALMRAAVTYFVIRIRVNAATAVGLLVLMLLLDVDDALLWAIGAFFLSFVPYLGLVLALIPPTILAFAESGPLAAVAIVAGGTALNLIAENVLEPALTGRALELSTWLVFASFFLWVWLLGPTGALLSMPITVLVVLVLLHGERTHWIGVMLARGEDDDRPSGGQTRDADQ